MSNGANTTTTFTGITLDGSLYVVPNGTVTFDGCVFKGMLRVPNGNGVVKVANCRFDGDKDENSTGKKNEYPFFFQAGGTLEFIGNTIAANTYKRGLNVGGLTELNATIENNTIGAVTAGYSAIQLSGGVTEAKIKGNKISLNGTNAFTLHGSLISADKVTKVTVEGNTITGNGYLIYDDAAANNKAFTSDNLTLAIGTNTVASTVNTTRGVKESVEYDIGETVATVVNKALTPAYVAKVNGDGYTSLAEAIAAAKDGDTIYVSAGEYTTYDNASPKKSLIFVGAGAGNTIWTIGDLSKNVDGEGNGDYSFDGCDTITFKDMTLKVDNANYRGFIRINHTIVENCTLEGRTAYWGYETATFTGCTFNAPEGDYALWDYSTKTMTFDGCEFNISGKGVNVYVEAGNAGSEARKVEAKDCTINSTKANKAFLNIKNSTQAYEVTLSGDNKVNGLGANSTTGSNLYQVEATTITETDGKTVKVQEKASDGTLTTVYEVKAASTAVATVGGVEYATLAEAIAALNSTNHTLALIDARAWAAATPVYWQAGTQSGYAAKLTDALTAAYKANAGDITIVCRPDADVGAMTHGHVADNLTVYGNNAYISGGECDLEVDTYMYSRETGKQVATGGVYLDKAITITAYELDNLGVWGQRHTGFTINISLNDCDGKAIEGKANVQRVYISGTTGVNNITVVGCDFLTKATALYSNADGKITIDNCSFAGSQVPVNFNHKANGTQTVTVKNSTFTNCGDNGDWKQFAAPVRFVNSGSGTSTATVDNCTFAGTVGANGDILLGDGRNGEASNDVALTVTNTAATVVAQRPGYYNGETTDTTKAASKGVTASETFKTSIDEMVVINVTGYVEDESGNVTISDEEGLFWFAKQVNSGNTFKGKTVKLANDITLTKTWTPVGVSVPNSFQGTFDGDGHSIVGMDADGAYQEYGLGFFKLVISATIKNVTFEKASVTGIYSNVVGIVSGYSYGSSTFENVHVVDSTVYAFGKVGGMVGMAEDGGATTTFKNCSVTGTTIHGGYNVAGFLGLVMGKCNISGSYLANNNIIIDENSYGFGKVTELDTAVTCDGSVDTCAGNGMVIRGRYIPNGEYYYSAYSDLYNHYGASSHDCTLTNGKYLANSEVVHDAPVKIGDVLYSDLKAAVDAVKSDEIITLLDDIDLGTDELSTYNVKSTVKNVTIDLGGHTLTSASKYTIYLKVNDWTIQNGTITNTNASTTYGTLYIGGSYNSTTLKNVTIESKTNGVYFAIASGNNGIKTSITVEDGTKISGNYGVYMKGQPKPWGKTRDGQEILNVNGGEITGKIAAIAVFGAEKGNTKAGVIVNINGGKVYSEGYAIAGNGSTLLENTTININGGSVISTKDTAIYHPQAGTVNVTGGTVSGVTGGIQMCAGTLNVTGGTITATGNGDVSGKTGDGSIPDGAAVSIVNRGYPAGAPTAAISGGVLTSAKNVDAVQAYEWSSGAKAEWSNPNASVSGGTFSSAVPEEYCADRYIPTQNEDGTYGVKKAMKGSKKNPYNLAELSEMTRDQYIAAQEALGCTMYVEIGNYSYDKDGVLGNGVRNDTPGQMPDHSKLNAYAENGYLGAKNDGANGKNIIFVGGSITSGVTGYTSIDNIGTSLLLAVPAYTNVTFEGTTFNNVMSFDYQLYTGPWSQLGELKFSGCTFNGLIVGAIAAQTLTFNGCEFKNYTNTISANNSNPTWIRPAYGNWSKGDNDGQGSDFKSLTTINFTNNTVTSTRPVKFERIAQWEMDTKVTVTGNKFDIKSDGSSKNVGLYFGANAKFDLVVDNNKKTDGTAALYTAVYKAPNGTDYAGLPAGSTVKDSNGADVEVAGVIWKTTDALTLKTTTEAVEVAGVKFATLEEAFAAAKNGDTITLLEDCKSDRINLEDKSVTVVLNGKTLTSTAAYGVMFCAKNGNKITIDGTVEGSKLVGTLMITSGTDGHIEVNGGTYESNQYCPIYVNGSVSSENSTVTVKNAIIQAINSNSDQDSGCAVYLAGYSTSVFENCTITAPITGIEIRAGKLTLNNCDVTGGNGEVTEDANGNGTTVTNAALAISQHTTKKPIDVTINGGTFNGTAAVYQTDVQGTGSADVKIAVNDGTFNGTISGETDGTITISGGKFKVKVDDKYFANGHVCSGNPGADGYYTIADHPITNMGLSIGEGLSLRIYLLDGVTTGKLRVTYTKPDGEEVSYIIDETEFELVGNEESGYTEKYFFRIFNITPQMADMTITVQYIGEDGKDFGSAKEVSILKYCEGYIAKYPTENVKTFVSKLLEYCASAMDYVAIKYSEQVYNGKTWTERATALRAEKERLCGTDVPTFDFKELGTNSKFGRKIFDTNGIIFGESLTFYLGIRKENYNPDYHYIPTGSNETKPVFDEKSGEYRFYFTMAPYEYNTSMRIVVKSGNSTICERATSLDFLLNKYSAGDSAAARFCKAAYEYCRALEAVIKDINK